MSKIFISYRRADSGLIGRITDQLTHSFGAGSVFLDYDSIPPGVNFREYFKHAVQKAKVFIAVIGPQWAAPAQAGHTSIGDANDPVRLELETALAARKVIIPVLVDGAKMPDAHRLPASIRTFVDYNALPVSSTTYFKADMEKLISAVEQVVGRRLDAGAGPAKSSGFGRKALLGGAVALAGAAAAAVLVMVNLGPTRTGPTPATQTLSVDIVSPSAMSVQPKQAMAKDADASTKGARLPGATPPTTERDIAPSAVAPQREVARESAPPAPATPQPPVKPSPSPNEGLVKSAALPSLPAPLNSPPAQRPTEPPRDGVGREPAPKAAPSMRIVTAIEGESFVLCGQPDFTISMYQPRPNEPTVVSLRRSGMMLADGLALQLSPGRPRNVVGNCDVAFVEVKQGFKPIVVLEEQRR